MEHLIEVDDLIKRAQKDGIDFGKGDPYNRLRYYTKIGLLPHMERKQNKDGKITGHYPEWALERLEYVEKLKSEGLNNDEILEEIQKQEKVKNMKQVFGNKESRMRIVAYATFVVLLLVLLAELEILPIGKSKTDFIEQPAQLTESPTLIASGSGFIPANEKRIFVKTAEITPTAKVYITFNNDYSPASRYWVSEIVPGRGFYVEMDTTSYEDAGFNWWLSN